MSQDQNVDRIDALEIIVAEQQQTIDDLNEVITKQWDAQELLKRQLNANSPQ